MLIYSKERLVTPTLNMLVLADKNGDGYLYVHRLLYDQAVIINDIYGEDLSMLVQAVTGGTESRPDVDYFFENAPSPINSLGAFLLLVKEEIEEYVDMVGAIHVISGPINLRGMLKIPFELRNNKYSFSLSIKEEYQLAWDSFFKTTFPYSDDMVFGAPSVTPMNGVMTSTVSEDDEEDGEQSYEDMYDTLVSSLMSDDDPFAAFDEEDSSSDEDTFDDEDEVVEEEEEEEDTTPSLVKRLTSL